MVSVWGDVTACGHSLTWRCQVSKEKATSCSWSGVSQKSHDPQWSTKILSEQTTSHSCYRQNVLNSKLFVQQLWLNQTLSENRASKFSFEPGTKSFDMSSSWCVLMRHRLMFQAVIRLQLDSTVFGGWVGGRGQEEIRAAASWKQWGGERSLPVSMLVRTAAAVASPCHYRESQPAVYRLPSAL